MFIHYLTPVPGTRVILGGISVYTLPDTCTRYPCHPRRYQCLYITWHLYEVPVSSSEVSVFIHYLTPVPGTRVILGGISVYTLPDTCTRYPCHPRRCQCLYITWHLYEVPVSSSEVSVFIHYLTPVPGTRVILGGISVYTLPDTCTRYPCHPRRYQCLYIT